MRQYSDTQKRSKLFTLGDVIVEGNVWPLVPDDEYVMRCLYHETVMAFRTPKVILHMQIVEPGQHHGKRLLRAYRVKKLVGKAGRGGHYELNPRHELLLTLVHLYEKRIRHDRNNLQALTKVLLRATTRTVTTDYQHRPLPEVLYYSVVDRLVAIEAGEL